MVSAKETSASKVKMVKVLILIMLEGGFCFHGKVLIIINGSLNPYYAGRWFLLNFKMLQMNSIV